ncbi:MAG: PLP-dependent transferase [Phycisphaeraceae bacterium]
MTSLLQNPLYLPEHLGQPLPGAIHAVSVCLPTWRDVVGYETGEPRVVSALRSGYPRFVYHPLCRELFERIRHRLNPRDHAVLVFPNASAARRCAAFIGDEARVHTLNLGELHATSFPPALADRAKCYWQHAGEGISSRTAEGALAPSPSEGEGTDAKSILRQRIAALAGASADDVYLYPTGMSAIFTLHRALRTIRPDRPAAQFGFPYVDTLKILDKFSPSHHPPLFFPTVTPDALDRLAATLARTPIAGLFTELPSNPLLTSPDLVRLAALARGVASGGGGPLVVDETLATWVNADVLHLADVSATSLTKFFSGTGDVAGGCLIVSRHGAMYDQLKSALESVHEDLLADADAAVLEHNSRDFAERMTRINANAAMLAEHLARHPKVRRVHYPMRTTAAAFDQVRRVRGGFGGLLSVELRNAPDAAPRFYDALRCCKGPNLGTNFTLVCPYTLLAHYNELDWAESRGVSRWLIRISAGLENAQDLIARFDEALDATT